MSLRLELEERERRSLSPHAALSAESKGRRVTEEECSLRPAFQHDRDRILYSKAFRRLKHKTQVFLAPTGDHYRTRLTHTLEVAQISRTMARALGLNEDLTEAIALGHDLGHTPFGHAGESVLGEMLEDGFRHYEQSLRVVDHLEKSGRGLNLTYEVRMGILHHSKGRGAFMAGPENAPEDLTLEARLVRCADVIAYVAHDTDDAIRGGVIAADDLPPEVTGVLGDRLSRQIDTMVRDLITRTMQEGGGRLAMSEEVMGSMWALRDFLYERVYDNMVVHADFIKASKVISELFLGLVGRDSLFEQYMGPLPPSQERPRVVADYIAGMTDPYALKLYDEMFLPRPWARL